jgi:hypothetical protein
MKKFGVQGKKSIEEMQEKIDIFATRQSVENTL